jgi:hypothetical protein
LEKDGALFATAIPDGARERYAVKVGGKFPTLQASEYTLKPVRWIDWLRGRAKFAGSTFDVFEGGAQLGTISRRGVLNTQYTVNLPASVHLVAQMFLLYAVVHTIETRG